MVPEGGKRRISRKNPRDLTGESVVAKEEEEEGILSYGN
jgi:hypothetical protein